jgi:hypothetical protein
MNVLSGSFVCSVRIYCYYYYYYYYYLFIYLNCEWVLPSDNGATIRRNTQLTHITQNNTPHSNNTQHTKLHKKYRTPYTH